VSAGRRVYLSAGLLALAALIVGLVTAPQYGVTSDEPVIYYGGEWQWWALGSQDPNRWKFKQDAPPEFRAKTPWTTHPDGVGHWAFPGFAGFVAAGVAKLARHLPGYNAVDAVHAGIVLLHAIFLFAFAVYLARLLGLRRALLAAALTALYPTAFSHSHYNVKDWPTVGFYALTLVSLAAGLLENRARFVLQSGVWLGLGVACKANPIFTVPTAILWLAVSWRLVFPKGGELPTRKLVGALGLLPWVALLTLYAAWPYLRSGTPSEVWERFSDMVKLIVERGQTGRDWWSAYSSLMVGTLSPPIYLLGLGLAAWSWAGRQRVDRAVLLLGGVWLALPLLRIAVPHSNYYDSNRHFLEYVPALALLAAMGLDFAIARGWTFLVARKVELSRFGRWAPSAALGAATLVAAWPVASYFPYESTYYNLFVGGFGGAQRRHITAPFCAGMEWWCPDSESDYWGYSLRNAVRDVNRDAPANSAVYPCGNLVGPLMKWAELRGDLRITGRDQAEYFILIPRRPFCGEDDQRYIRENGLPVHVVEREGGLVYGVFRRKR
jgi:hypothetical protein